MIAQPTSCPFCNLTQRVLKANRQAFVILSNPRKVPGHFLVIPKRHVLKPWELAKSEIADLFELINFVEQRIIKQLSKGCDVRQHYRPYIKQGRIKVDHVHYHVIPRDMDDSLYRRAEAHETAMFEELDPREAQKIAKILT